MRRWLTARLSIAPSGTELEVVRHDGHVDSLGTVESAIARKEAFEAMREALRSLISGEHVNNADCREAGERMDEECPKRTQARAALALADKVKA